ncbi:MAG: D-glycerate dehydrogenase [Nitrospira sp.]|nr:D-glycerate dehydrogenase [Nitrospira sp.]MBH0196489.1 D-glycerate dehydrogenase [Nitrospira sp.]
MARPALYVTRRLPDSIMSVIREQYRLIAEPTDQPPPPEAHTDYFAQAEAVICTLADRIDAPLLSNAPHLKIVANYAVGYNNIDLAAAQACGIVVTNTPDVLTDATADLTWALLFAIARRVAEGDRWIRSGTWPGWAPTQMLGFDVSDKTLGIIGMGRIGQAVAQRAQGFRMTVAYASRRPVTAPAGVAWNRRSFDEVLRQSDFLSLHVPLTDSTRHFIGSRELGMMKPTAILLNTSRGSVIDEAAFVSALQTGIIAGAGLDVYEHEPAIHPGLMTMHNVVLLPHLGSATQETRIRMGQVCLDNIAAVLGGIPAPNQVRSG